MDEPSPSQRELQKRILSLFSNFRGVDPLKELFWNSSKYLGYQRRNEPLSQRGWEGSPAECALAEDPVLFASCGAGDDFKVIYARIDSDDLRLGPERAVVTKLLRDHPSPL